VKLVTVQLHKSQWYITALKIKITTPIVFITAACLNNSRAAGGSKRNIISHNAS